MLVSYDYWVDGYRYSGRQRLFTIWRFGLIPFAAAQELRVRYAKGRSLTVYVDPGQPAEAVIEPRADSTAVITCVMFGVLALVSAAVFTLDLLDVLTV